MSTEAPGTIDSFMQAKIAFEFTPYTLILIAVAMLFAGKLLQESGIRYGRGHPLRSYAYPAIFAMLVCMGVLILLMRSVV